MIIANGAGSAPDVIGRLLANKLAESWSQPIIVDNRPGATGLIAAELISRAAPDGHTMFLSTMTQLISTLMNQRYMLGTDLGAVALVGTTPFAIIVGPGIPVKNIAEWIAYAKARQGELRYGSAGNWGSGHLCMERFNAMNGLRLTHVPYANTVHAMTEIGSGSIHVYCTAVPSLPSFTAVGKVRVLGVTYRPGCCRTCRR
jgi:tripartite-type tricarboxylate transporter receptor subunit TctC